MIVTRRRGAQSRGGGGQSRTGPKKTKCVPLDSYNATYEKELTLPEFEKYASSRLNVLRWIHEQKGKGVEINEDSIMPQLKENDLDRDAVKDNISHFINRMAFCNKEDNRRWFLAQEIELFKVRYAMAKARGEDTSVLVDELMGQKFETVTKQQLAEAGDAGRFPLPQVQRQQASDGSVSYHFTGSDSFGRSHIVKFPYYKVSILDSAVYYMVMKRRVFVKDGFAYVPSDQFKQIIFGRYRTHLSKALLECRSKLQKLQDDQRVYNIVATLHKATVGDQYKSNAEEGSVRPKDVPNLVSRGSFPLCMHNSYQYLKNDSHLKHTARMHFGTYLKGIGMTMEDSLKFWQKAFSKKTSGEKFRKNYAYNIRHTYGKEGKRTSLSGYSCNSIINGSYANDDHAGCPFKMFDAETLSQRLRSVGMNPKQVNEIVEKASGKHYTIACRMVFQHSHQNIIKKRNLDWEYEIEGTSRWDHPNNYFDISRQLHEGLAVGEKPRSASTTASAFPTTQTQAPTQTQPQAGARVQPMESTAAMDLS